MNFIVLMPVDLNNIVVPRIIVFSANYGGISNSVSEGMTTEVRE